MNPRKNLKDKKQRNKREKGRWLLILHYLLKSYQFQRSLSFLKIMLHCFCYLHKNLLTYHLNILNEMINLFLWPLLSSNDFLTDSKKAWLSVIIFISLTLADLIIICITFEGFYIKATESRCYSTFWFLQKFHERWKLLQYL